MRSMRVNALNLMILRFSSVGDYVLHLTIPTVYGSPTGIKLSYVGIIVKHKMLVVLNFFHSSNNKSLITSVP